MGSNLSAKGDLRRFNHLSKDCIVGCTFRLEAFGFNVTTASFIQLQQPHFRQSVSRYYSMLGPVANAAWTTLPEPPPIRSERSDRIFRA
jgi:hypothetical protein